MIQFLQQFATFDNPSWDGWKRQLARITPRTREIWWLCGRGAGKSLIAATVGTWLASREWPRTLNENPYVGIFSPSKRQSRVTFQYVKGLLADSPALAAMVVNETQETITLSNGVIIECIVASVAAPRGRSYVAAIVEETAFLQTDELSANPDTEILRAIRPGLARVPGSLLVAIGSPYARRGEAWKAHCAYGATGGSADGTVLYHNAPTLELNPTFDKREIDRAMEADPQSADAEYNAVFRTDLESYVPVDLIDQVTIPGRVELPSLSDTKYCAFIDPSGGSNDSFTMAIAHAEGDTRVLDCVREFMAPCNPEWVVAQMNPTLRSYGCTVVTGDRYAGEWPRVAFLKHGIIYEPATSTKSELYLTLLPLLRAQRVELLDHTRLKAQLVALERRVARGGKESVDHPPGGHDDIANAVAGALVDVEAINAPGLGIRQLAGGEPWSGRFNGCVFRGGEPWEGVLQPEYDEKGRPLHPPVRFIGGVPQKMTPEAWAELKKNGLPQKRAGKTTKIVWG